MCDSFRRRSSEKTGIALISDMLMVSWYYMTILPGRLCNVVVPSIIQVCWKNSSVGIWTFLSNIELQSMLFPSSAVNRP